MVFKLRSDRGDTIVEVLIAIAVVSSVLAITYSVMNRNLQLLRTNQERTEASKIAQSQLEQLKSEWNGTAQADQADFFARTRTTAFCMVSGSTPSFTGDAAHVNIAQDNFAYPAGCGEISTFYYASIKYNSSEGSYTVRVRWDGLTGDRNEVLMGYKLQ